MSALIDREVARFVSIAKANHIAFEIVMEDGRTFGGIDRSEVVKPKRRPRQYPYGTFKSIFVEKLVDMNVGEVRVIDAGEYELETLRSGLTAYASSVWGNGTYTTAVNRNENTFEILRLS